MRRKKWYSFLAVFMYEENNTISVRFPDLPGCFSAADTLEEALKNAKEAMGLHIWSMEEDGDEIPKPTSLNDITLLDNEAAHVVEVFMPPIRDKINSGFVKKTLSLPSWLANKADESGVNCSKLFQKALMDYLGVSSLDDDKRKVG